MSAGFIIGFGVAIILGALVLLVVELVQRSKGECGKAQYDERQVAARGKAFQAGFFTLLGCGGLAAGLEAVEVPWLNHGMGMVLAILIGVTVFALVAIHKDAYMGLNQKPGRSLTGLGLVMLVNLVSGIAQLMHGWEESWQGRINLMVSAMLLLVIAAQSIHLLRIGKEQEDE